MLNFGNVKNLGDKIKTFFPTCASNSLILHNAEEKEGEEEEEENSPFVST